MPKLTIEAREREKPIILLWGEMPLFEDLTNEFNPKFKIVRLSDDNKAVENIKDFYRVSRGSSYLLNNLEEKIDYAVILINQSDRQFLPQVFQKIEHDQTKTVVLINIFELDKFYDIILEYKKLKFVHFLFFGDIYSEKGYYKNSEISKIIEKAITNKSIVLSGNDLNSIFPLYITDAIAGISHVLFASSGKNNFYYLFYAHPETLISAVHILRRVEHDLEIKYEDEKKSDSTQESYNQIEREIESKIITTPIFLDKYLIGFERSISFFEGSSIEIRESKRTIPIHKAVFAKRNNFKPVWRAALYSLILFFVFNVLFISITAMQFRSSVDALNKHDYQTLSSNLKRSKLLLEITKPTLLFVAKSVGLLGMKDVKTSIDDAQRGINLLSMASSDFDKLEQLSKGVNREDLDNLISDAIFLYFKAEEELATSENSALKALITPDLPAMISLAPILPDILGFGSEKNYLIIFQNNGELRPTGGFIGSIGELKIRSGKIEKLSIQDVYEYDGKLKAHIEPHYIIRRYLQPHLYLRDSNFDPDFQKSASSAALLYNLETGKKVDGVIALNFEAVRQLIGEVGPVTLTSYNKTLDETNSFDFLQNTIDESFFPGSTAKKDVLQALFNQLTLKLEGKNNFIKTARILPKLLHEKHILFAFNATSIQEAFSANGYGGQLRDLREKQNTIKDFLAINEANIGMNKANINVLRETIYERAIEDTKATSKVTHVLYNGNDDKEYKAYIRIFTPIGSNLTSISVNGENKEITEAITNAAVYENKSFTPPKELEVDNSVESGMQVFGFITTVPQKTKQIIEVIYDNGARSISSPVLSYSLFLSKQPGTLDYPFTLRLSYDESFAPKEVDNAKLAGNSIIISRKVNKDQIVEMELIKR